MLKGRSTSGRSNGATAHEPEDYDSVQLPNVMTHFLSFPNVMSHFYHFIIQLPDVMTFYHFIIQLPNIMCSVFCISRHIL